MFSIQQSNELVFPVEDDKILEELLADHVLLSGSTSTNSLADHVLLSDSIGTNCTNNNKDTKKRQRISSVGIQKNKDGNVNEINNKKVVHREIEKQRRQEMTKLCASLRSLLPVEFLKGKRSVSDHMHEAVNYIKHIQTSIEELSLRRDELKNSCNSSSAIGAKNRSSSSVGSNHSITLNPCRDGVEILISCIKPEGFHLSRVLIELLEMGLNVISCETTKVNDKLLHRIQIEASDLTAGNGIDLSMLQERLTNMINNRG